MAIIKTNSGAHEIIASGTLISFGGENIEIIFKPENNSTTQQNLKLTFSFNDDSTSQESRMETFLKPEENNLEFKLFNFNSGLDLGNVAPLSIGNTVDNKQLFLNYRARKIGDSWTLDYSIYQQK